MLVGELAIRLYQRLNEAVILQRGNVETSELQPNPQECHRNVALWCERDGNSTPVQGWLVADYSVTGIAINVQFFAHSVVRTESGDLIDITPNTLNRSYRFLIHDAADGDFDEMVNAKKISSVIYQAEAKAE